MKPRRREFLLSGLLAAPLAAQSNIDDTIFRVDTLTVSAPVTVLDRDGRLVNGLEAKDFTLLDNGVAQDIKVDVSYVPISMVLAIQANNVVEPFLPTIKKLGGLLEGLVIGEQGECAVMAFDHRHRVLTDGFVNDTNEVKRALEKINPGSSTSAMIDTIFDATRLLRNRPANRRRILLLVSETQDRGSEGRLREALLAAQINNIIIYSININRLVTKLAKQMDPPPLSHIPPGGRPLPPGAAMTPTNVDQFTNYGGATNTVVPIIQELFTQAKAIFVPNPIEVLTKHTGGREYSFLSQRDMEEVMSRLGEEVHSQYLISYSPNEKVRLQGGWHDIKVEVTRGYKPRTRPGYWIAAKN
jgi:VWFA-related protein